MDLPKTEATTALTFLLFFLFFLADSTKTQLSK